MSVSSVENKRIAKNTLFLYIRMFFVLVVSLYTSRVVLNCLGVSDYGVFNVVSGFVSLFGFLNATLSSSMQRFYNIEIGLANENGVQNIYTTGFWIHAAISVIVLLSLETFGLWYINYIMNIDNSRLYAANIVFQTAAISLIAVIMQSPYIGAVMAFEKMGVYSLVSIFDTFLKLAMVFLLQFSGGDKLILYSILLMTITILNLIFYFFYSKIKLEGIQLSGKVDVSKVKEMLSFSGWNLIGTFAFVINGQGLNLLLNSFFGTVINAARGVAFQVKTATTGFTSSITTAFRPQIVEAYAREEVTRVRKLFYIETKICISLILFLITPIILEIDSILEIWLGKAIPPYTNIFTILVLFNILICTINPIVNQVAFATGKIKRYQIANSLVNILVIPTSWIILELGANATSVFIVTIIFSILNQTVCLMEMNKLFNINLALYLRKVILRCIIMACCVFAIQLMIHDYLIDIFIIRLILIIIVDFIVIATILYFYLLDDAEKELIRKYCSKKYAKS